MILTLQEWQKPQYSDFELEKVRPQAEGFEHFVDQVSESSRDFAMEYDEERLRTSSAAKRAKMSVGVPVGQQGLNSHRQDLTMGEAIGKSYLKSSRAIFTAFRRSYEDHRMKGEIQGLLPFHDDESTIERRARMLLQSAAFLDIDKVISYNSPLPRFNFWRRSGPPQLTCLKFDASYMPILKSLRCKICRDVIRGVLFKCLERKCEAAIPLSQRDSICETCYRVSHHPPNHMTKFYKHLILRDIITSQISRKICICQPSSSAGASSTRFVSLFPIDNRFPHRGKGKSRVLKCGLLLLSEEVMEAKYQGTLTSIEKGRRKTLKSKITKEEEEPNPRRRRLKRKNATMRNRRNADPQGKTDQKTGSDAEDEKLARAGTTTMVESTPRRRKLKRGYATTRDLMNADPQGKTDEKTLSDVENEKLANKQIPYLGRKIANRYPFGNVHMALMFGPLMIENGVPE